MNNVLWYDREAEGWDEALPLGNGRMGAMVFSGTVNERLALNDDTLWSGVPQAHDVPGAARDFSRARELALAGKYKEAQAHIEAHCLAKNTQRYLPLGDLLLEMPEAHAAHRDYRRSLDIGNALLPTRYGVHGVTYHREVFVSGCDHVLVMRISADATEAVSFTARLDCQLESVVCARDRRLTLKGQAPGAQGMKFIAVADFETERGTVEAIGDALHIKNADAVCIRMAWRTNFKDAFTPPMQGGVRHEEMCLADLARSLCVTYDGLKARHVADYHKLFKRVDIHFGEAPDLPLPRRLARWEASQEDPALFALLFQYGRYLMIAGSRPLSRAMNLQGIWSHHLWPPWSGNYTLNINTQMNYWLADVGNLAECGLPLEELACVLQQTGAHTARAHYGAGGFVAHHNSDVWGMSTPVEAGEGFGASRWAFWPLAGGWLCASVFNRYLYNPEENKLATFVWPLVRDAARFFLDVLVEDTDGTLIFAPSTSPENDFIYDGGPIAVCKTATMTTAIVRETLTNAIQCCDWLEDATSHADFRAEAAAALARLPEYKTGSRGELLEWSEELPEYEPAHRHTSHLYPLYPGREIEAGTPLADACRRTLDLRGDEGTGWALAWRICLFARLRDPERAFSFLKKQLRPSEGWLGGCYPNLFGAHPPFQIDSNFGAAAGIGEMLLQSTPDGTVRLLPALPAALGTGWVRGLRAMGGVTLDMAFEKGILREAVLTLDNFRTARNITLEYKGSRIPLALAPGEGVVYAP
ncbi:MAG: glycoside hydrolase family 95 protein [Defluviitaleaceae bacterium]|nr:glycoside hydrolase family 95 protein [Defluviitaleaceae bacterium]MCL2239499.1 glycoside hydrolase family 95 protein [Defluviitaleaceae bacterium]